MYRFEATIYPDYGHPLHGHGFYRVPYDYNQELRRYERYLDVTQFEAIDARLVFPCFDQPDMKGTSNYVEYQITPKLSRSIAYFELCMFVIKHLSAWYY